MNVACLRTYHKIASPILVATATALAAVSLAGTASADAVALDRDLQRTGCNGAPGSCGKPVVLQFTNTTPTVVATVTNIVGNEVDCPKIDVFAVFDGGNTTYIFPVHNGRPFDLSPGSHTVALDGVCQEGVSFTHWGGHIQISNVGDAPAQSAGQGVMTATVTADVDRYNGANGTGGTSEFLPAGKTVKVVAPCTPDAWCNLIDPPGSAWGQFLKNN
jgi:hypothetical protein